MLLAAFANVGHAAKCFNTVGQSLLDGNVGRAAKTSNIIIVIGQHFWTAVLDARSNTVG